MTSGKNEFEEDVPFNAEEGKAVYLYLEKIEDPRKARGIRYKLADVLLIMIYSILCGYTEPTDIEEYGNTRLSYFSELLGIVRIPSHDTFSRMLQMIDFEQLGKYLGVYLRDSFPDIARRYDGYKVRHIDGKACNAANLESVGEKPKYVLNSMVDGEGIGTQILPIGDKENEISKLPEYLQLFDLSKTIVTIDAIGTNKTVIDAIEGKGGKYVLLVKENQKKLRAAICDEVKKLRETGKYEELETVSQTKKAHGREEKIEAHMIRNTAFIIEKLGEESCFNTVAKVCVVEKTVTKVVKGEQVITKNEIYLITDLETMSLENLLKIRQRHWDIEMEHYVIDMWLDEDRSTARKNNALANSAILKRFATSIKRYDEECKDKSFKKFEIRNASNPKRIESLLFGTVVHSD